MGKSREIEMQLMPVQVEYSITYQLQWSTCTRERVKSQTNAENCKWNRAWHNYELEILDWRVAQLSYQ